MKRSVRHVLVGVASAMIASGAVLGAGGAASAATSGPAEHAPVTGFKPDGEHESRQGGAVGYDNGRDRHDNGRDRRDGRSGHGSHGDAYRGSHRAVDLYRWGGHRLYVWSEGRWVDVTPLRGGRVDFWYVDQILSAQR